MNAYENELTIEEESVILQEYAEFMSDDLIGTEDIENYHVSYDGRTLTITDENDNPVDISEELIDMMMYIIEGQESARYESDRLYYEEHGNFKNRDRQTLKELTAY